LALFTAVAIYIITYPQCKQQVLIATIISS